MTDSDKPLPSSSNQAGDGQKSLGAAPSADDTTAEEQAADDTPAPQTSDVGKPNPILQTVVASALILGYLAILAYMFLKTGSAEDKQWLRMSFLFGSIEALVFAVAGFLFGQSIKNPREFRLQQKEADAKKKAEQEAERAGALEEAGAELAEIVERQASTAGRGEESAVIQAERDLEAALYYFKKVAQSSKRR